MTRHEILLLFDFVLCNHAVEESRLSNFRGRRVEGVPPGMTHAYVSRACRAVTRGLPTA